MQLAEKQIDQYLSKLKVLITSDERSMRTLSAETKNLEIPERVYHTILSELLNRKPGRNMYFQTFLVLLKLLGVSIEEFILGDKRTADVAKGFQSLKPAQKKDIANRIAAYMDDGSVLQERINR